MNRIIFTSAFAFSFLVSSAQLNMTQTDQIDYNPLHNTGCSNLWGYTDELGNEYAIVGLNNGTSIVNVTNPNNVNEIWYLPDSNSIWREVKVWGDYAYVTTEEAAGLLIIDLSPLPGSTVLPNYRFWGPSGNQFSSAHSLFIDENGVLYLHGTDRGNGGVIFYDLAANPVNPPELGEYDNYYVHDSYARGDTLYAAHISDGFLNIVDVSNKSNPVIMATQVTPSIFTHNAWINDAGTHVFTTDEVSNAYIASYNITNLSNITEADRTRSLANNNGNGSIPHNTYYNNGYLYTSYYRDGVVIHDVSDPENMIEVANYDVSTSSGDGFNSVWGVYPYFSSGTIIASDMENGLYVFSANLVQACKVHGTVTDASTTNPILNAEITIIGQPVVDYSDNAGGYKTGLGAPGTYNIAFYKTGYERDTAYNVVLTNGDTVIVDMALTPLVPFTLSGTVTEAISGTPIANAQVQIVNTEFTASAVTNASGNYSMVVYEGNYEIASGHWGHTNFCTSPVFFDAANNTYNMQLAKGYYDDFYFDFGWTASGNATNGDWVRELPIPTGLPGNIAVNPWFDESQDCGEICYMTGNDPGSVGAFDVDGGTVTLTSPVFDGTLYIDPWVEYSRWFYNGGGNGNPNDTLKVKVSNGSTTVTLEQITDDNFTMSQWNDTTRQLSSVITITNNMRFIIETRDSDLSPHLVEGGLDRWKITEGNTFSVSENEIENELTLYPNPANGFVNVKVNSKISFSVELIDITGKIIFQSPSAKSEIRINTSGIVGGIYFVRINTGETTVTKKLVVEK